MQNGIVKPLYIIGAGGFGREVAWMVERINANPDKTEKWDLKGFLDDNKDIYGNEIDGYRVLGGHEVVENAVEDVWCVLAIGSAKGRKKGIARLTPFKHIHFATLIDPDVIMSDSVRIGEGCMICAGNILTVDISIGDHCILNLDCTVGHDAVINDYVTVYPGANISGGVKIGECTEIGTGTAIIQGLNIGKGVVIGAGSTVIRDVEDEVTAVGCPVKVVKHH